MLWGAGVGVGRWGRAVRTGVPRQQWTGGEVRSALGRRLREQHVTAHAAMARLGRVAWAALWMPAKGRWEHRGPAPVQQARAPLRHPLHPRPGLAR